MKKLTSRYPALKNITEWLGDQVDTMIYIHRRNTVLFQ